MSLYLVPSRANALARGTVTPSSESPIFTREALYDGRSSVPFQLATLASATVVIDTALNPNSNLETWSGGVPTGYSVTNVTQGTGKNGLYGADLGNSTGSLSFIVTLRPGEPFNIHVWGKPSISSPNCVGGVRFQNLRTGKYLADNGIWTTPIDCISIGGAVAWVEYTIAGTLEDYDACQDEDVPCLVTVRHPGSTGTISVDDLWVNLSSINACSVHGHWFFPGSTLTLESSLDGTTYQAATTLTPRRGPFYALNWTPYSGHGAARYFKLTLQAKTDDSAYTGVATPPWFISELVLGHAVELRQHKWGGEVAFLRQQTRSTSRGGSISAQDGSGSERRTLKLRMQDIDLAAWRKTRDMAYRSTRGGVDNALWIWDSTDADACLFGRLNSSWGVTRTFQSINEHDLTIAEDADPIRATM